MKKKWWIFGGVLAAMLLSLCVFGVRLRIAPRLILSRALGSTLTQLETRFAESPAHLIAPVLDPEGRQKAQLQLETETEHLGVVRYDMTIHTQRDPNRVLSQGTVVTGGKALDLSLYLDGDFAAVSSQGLLDETFYGITYDSFSRDIRSRELLAMLLGNEIITGWEGSVEKLDSSMDLDLSMPELSWEDIRGALYGALALKPRVSRIDTPAGGAAKTYAVTFRATGQEIAEAASPYREKIPPELLNLIDEWNGDPLASVQASFFLHEGKLVQIEANLDTSGSNVRITACLGSSPETEPLSIELQTKTGEDLSRTSLTIETDSDEASYRETLCLTQTDNGVQKKLSVDYDFDFNSGEMDLELTTGKGSGTARLNLAGEGDTFTIITQDAAPLVNLFIEKPRNAPVICTLRIAPGENVQTPEYRNLSEWSLEDLFNLLTGLGGLLGLKLP